MLALNRISRLRVPRSNLASTALLIITFSVFAVIAHLAVEQQRNSAEMVRESTPATSRAEQLDLWSLWHHLRF